MFVRDSIVGNKVLRIDSSFLLKVTIALLGIVIYGGNVMTVNTSKITDIICLAAFTAMPISGIVSAICFLVPLHSGITGLYIYGYAVLMILIKSQKLQRKIIIPLVIIIVYELVMMMFAGMAQINGIVVYALTVFLLLYMMNTDRADPKVACISYICGTVLLLLCVFTTAIQNSSLNMVLSGAVRIGQYEGLENLGQIAVVTENANALAYYALVAIMMAFGMVKKVKMSAKILLIAAIVFSTVIALFTVSRSFVIFFVVMVVLFYFTNQNLKQKLKVLAVIGLVLAVTIPYLYQKTQIFSAFTERFEDESMVTGTGRTDIFLEYMNYLLNNPLRLLFGTGSVFYRNVCNLSHSMHNGTQQILVSYGALGFIPVLMVLFDPVRDYFKNNKFELARLLPLIAVILFTQTIQFLNPNNLMLPFAIAVLYMKIPDLEVKR